jgi:uncharacterized protein (DUF1501 family)
MPFTRRGLFKGGALVAFGLTAPTFLTITAQHTAEASISTPTGANVLIVLQLGGGNDGLNTVIPYADPAYRAARPTLAIPEPEVLPLSEYVGLHPSMAALKARFDAGQFAIIQGVGYPNPNRSHFRSMEIWQTARPDAYEPSGWLGRYLDANCCGDDRPASAANGGSSALEALTIGESLPRSFWTEHSLVPAISNLAAYEFQTDRRYPDDRTHRLEAFDACYAAPTCRREYEEFLRRVGQEALVSSEELRKLSRSYQPAVQYPASALANNLKSVAQMIAADMGTRIFYVSTGGFDTHANQKNTHANLLKQVSDALDAFMKDLEEKGKADRVVVLAFSEFGRRVKENGSLGTDHGAAAPMFLLGHPVAGGLHSTYPSLTDLENGDLKMTVDFRTVYASVLRDWLGTPPQQVLGGDFGSLPLLRS